MAKRTCLVLSLLPNVSLESDSEITAIAHAIKSSKCGGDLDLQWHDVVHRSPDQLLQGVEGEYEDVDNEDQTRSRFLASCSVLTDILSALGEKSVLDIINGLCLNIAEMKCEVWLTAPCRIPIFANSMEDLICDDDSSRNISLVREFGMAILTRAIDSTTLESLVKSANERIQAAERAVSLKRPELKLGLDLFAFSEFSSRGGHRFDLLFADDEASKTVFQVGRTGPWIPAIQALLGVDFQFMVSVVYSRPGADAQDWHTDGAHRDDGHGWDEKPPVAPYAVCVFLALIDLDRTVGFTQFWPSTHRHAGLAGFGRAAPVLGCAVDGLLRAGGCAVYDYRLMHRGMPNASATTQRPLIQFLYHTPSYHETKNYGLEPLFS
jgi:hypothetical protein